MRLTDQRGFTLIEMLVAAGLSLFIMASIGGVFRAQSHTVKGQESRMEAHEYALTVLDVMVREIRNTGYYPGAACDATGGIVSASATSINIRYDKNGDGLCSGDDEVITFAFAGSDVTRNPLTTNQVLTDGNQRTFSLPTIRSRHRAPLRPHSPHCLCPLPTARLLKR